MTPEKIHHTSGAPWERTPPYAPPAQTDVDSQGAALPLSHYFWILKRHRWRILGFVAACVVCTWILCARLTPIYEATTRIDVDRRAPSGFIGQDSAQNNGSSNDADQFLTTQIELIQSDSVLRPVEKQFHVLQREQRLPTETELSEELEDAPLKFNNLKVVRPSNSFILRISYRSPDRRYAADVTNAIAKSYLEHTFDIRVKSAMGMSAFMERQLDELKVKMEGSSMALAKYEKDLNVINPEEKTNILSARLLQLNTEYTAAQGERVSKQAAYNSLKTGSLAAVQVSAQAEPLAKLQELLQGANQRLAEMKTTFGPNYVEYKREANRITELQRQYDESKAQITQRIEVDFKQAANREDMLREAVAETKAESDKLNAGSFEYQQRKREAESDKKLYDELIQRIKEAGINAGFQNSAIRIADPARPGANPVFPQKGLMLVLSLVISIGFALGVAIIADMVDNTVRDPEQAMRMLQVDVIGALPEIRKNEMPGLQRVFSIEGSIENGLTALPESTSVKFYRNVAPYEEAIRTIRNSILLRDLDRRVKSILITSALPAEGKSTLSAHLAFAHAEQGKKTLLIDADLRRPSEHKHFAVSNNVGLSTVLTGVLPWREVVIKGGEKRNLDIITAGPASRRASDLFGQLMIEILDEAARDYDLIVIDAPPILGFAEPLQLATAVDGVVVVTRAGKTSRKAVATVLTTLARLRANVLGLALNHVTTGMSDSYSYYRHFRQYYST